MSRHALPVFEDLAHSSLKNVEDYLRSEDRLHLQRIFAKTLNHRTAVEERAGYHPGYEGGLDYELSVPRRQLDRGERLSDEIKAAWVAQLGLDMNDIRELLAISERFTEGYNHVRRTNLSPQAGRALLLKMTQADQLGERITAESSHRRAELARHEVREYLWRNRRIRPAAEFVGKLSEMAEITWRGMSRNEALLDSARTNDLRLYYKTAEGDYGYVELLPGWERLVIAGHIYREPSEISRALQEYSGLEIHLPTRHLNGVERVPVDNRRNLFNEIDGIIGTG